MSINFIIVLSVIFISTSITFLFNIIILKYSFKKIGLFLTLVYPVANEIIL